MAHPLWFRRLLSAALCGAVAVGSGVSLQALAATKKKKDDASAPPAAAPAPKNTILSTKNALKETKVRQGPAKYNDNALAGQTRDTKADQKRDEEIEELEKLIPTQSG